MNKKVHVELNDTADDFFKQMALDTVNKNGLDLTCPKCGNQTHISFSGDTCKFCGLVIEYGTDPRI